MIEFDLAKPNQHTETLSSIQESTISNEAFSAITPQSKIEQVMPGEIRKRLV